MTGSVDTGTLPSALVVPPPTQQPGYDLRAVLRAAHVGGAGVTSAGHRRIAQIIDPEPCDISAVTPATAVGFTDGCQSELLLRHVAHRPASLIWVAAGAVTSVGTLLAFRQRIALVASAADAEVVGDWSEAGGGVPVTLLEELTPWGVAAATKTLVDTWRRDAEREVVMAVDVPDGAVLIVDGPIRHYRRDRLVGVVKQTDGAQYLPNETAIPDRAGWRSSVFRLPATTTAERDVVSCYLRLHDAPGSASLFHGCVRLEAPDVPALEAACAMALRHRQGPGSGDPRWATHLDAMSVAETVIKSFQPFALDI